MSFSVKKSKDGFEIMFKDQVIARGDRNFGYNILRSPGDEAREGAAHIVASDRSGRGRRVSTAPKVTVAEREALDI